MVSGDEDEEDEDENEDEDEDEDEDDVELCGKFEELTSLEIEASLIPEDMPAWLKEGAQVSCSKGEPRGMDAVFMNRS